MRAQRAVPLRGKHSAASTPGSQSNIRARKSVVNLGNRPFNSDMKALTLAQKITGMQKNDRTMDGRYFVAVRSTKIYCLPSCTARTPLSKNVLFYDNREDAVAAGFRACKRCRPNRFPDILPTWVPELIAYMREHRTSKLSEHDLAREAKVDISTIRRHFIEELGITPLAFHRRQRLLFARQLITQGYDSVTASLEAGFESMSGFRSAFVKQFGTTPGRIGSHVR